MTRAILTWLNQGKRTKEIVTIIPDNEVLYGDGGIVIGSTSDILNMDTSLVFFEDETGIFGVKPEKILNIEIIDRDENSSSNENNSTKENVMNRVKKVANASKNFVSKHRVELAVVATALVVSRNARESFKRWDQFLDDKGLTDEFYCNY